MLFGVQNVRKSFAETEVLKDVSLNVDKGDVVVILGPSGSGKTTFLRCLNFLERADGGTMDFHGTQLSLVDASKSEIAAVRKKTGFVFQNYNLFANKTALENVTLGLTVGRGMAAAEAKEIGMDALRRVGMAERADYYPAQLSGGQQQRVAIARALCMSPQIIYFDEATSALDPKLTEDMHALIRELAADGMAVGIVTHEMGFAREVSDRVCFLIDGQIVEQGTPEQVIEHPQDERTQAFLSRSTD